MVLVRRPPAPLWPSLFFVAFMTFVWCLGEVMETYVVDSEAWYQRWLTIEYTGVLTVPAIWWYFSLRFAEMHGAPLRPGLGFVRWGPLVLAAGFWLAMLTNPWHGQFFSPVLGQRNEFHAIWFAQASISYVLMLGLIGLFLWLRRRATEPMLRQQLTILTAALAVPMAFNFLWISALVPEEGAALTSVGLGISMLLFFAGIYRDRLFSLNSISMHHLIEHEMDGMLVIDRHGHLLHSNPAAARLLDGGLLSANTDVFDLLARQLRSGDDGRSPDARAIEHDLMSSERPSGGVLYRLDGDPSRSIEIHVVPIPDRSGRRLGTGLRLRDVTALREAREQLREQAAVLEAILGSAEQGMLVVDSKGEMIYSNRAFRELWSVKDADPALSESDASLSQVISQIVSPEAFLSELAALDDERVDASRREMVLRDGRIIERSSQPLLMDRTIAGRVWSFFDVTAERVADRERHQLERQMLQAQKMESLGILAGGIAHDFNNLLVGILGNADLALSSVLRDSPLHGPLTDIVDSSRRAAELTNQMLAYSGRSRFILEPIDLPGLTEQTRNLIEAVISKSARVELDLDPVSQVEGDPAQLRQVIMNLITNASDALKGAPGTIRVSTSEREIGPEELAGYQLGDTVDPGIFVCLEVSDTGSGMDEEITGRIFDPFFTTKFTGRGLGLSAVLGIVRAHHGAIRVDSRLGRGTTIRLLLPPSVHPTVGVDGKRAERASEGEWVGSGRVLVADDEPPVLRVLARTLERAGFEVVTALNGREALERWAEHAGDFVAVMLDMTMPEQGGRETLVALRKSGADVPIVLSSGYSEDEARAQFDGERPDAFLQKPYATHTLLETLRTVIDARRSSTT